jgi:hypothetical protein
MIDAEGSATTVQAWLARLRAPAAVAVELMPACEVADSALAALAAAVLAENHSLLMVTADDQRLADLSNTVELSLRPLCLVLPTAEYALRIALRASLALLKSRLVRSASDTEAPVWARQRQRLADLDQLWRACQAWSVRALESEPWPADFGRLFPVQVLPSALARNWSATADWVVVVDATRHPDYSPGPWPGASRTLVLGEVVSPVAGALVATDPMDGQRSELELLAQELSELELELATAQAEITDFSRRYHDLIGSRIAMLDALQAELAARRAAADGEDLEAARTADTARTRAQRSQDEQRRYADLEQQDERPFFPNRDLKKLYRTLAQRIHPDRARSEHDRAWRTLLMSEANRAYRANDRSALEEILSLWAEGVRSNTAGSTDADSLNLEVTRLKRRVAEIETELNRLFRSKLYELFTAANIAHRAGRDLLQEMAYRLDADITAASA